MFLLSLPMRGRGLKYEYIKGLEIGRDVAPHAGRGLKYIGPADSEKVVLSLPMRGAWIEICPW